MLHSSQNIVPGGGREKDLLAEMLLQVNSAQIYSASPAQQRLWFLDQMQEGGSTAYNVHVGLSLKGSLDRHVLQEALQEIVNRHDAFRTAFRLEGDKLLQLVTEAYSADIPFSDVTSEAKPYPAAYEIAQHEIDQPFDLSKAPLFRVRLIRISPDEHVFLCTMHHIVTDAGSLQLFAKELAVLYDAFADGRPSPLPPLPIRYGDFSEWQLECFQTGAVEQQVTYWKNKLEGAPPFLELPADAPRPSEQTFEGTVEIGAIPSPVIDRIKTLAARFKATPFMLELAAFKILLYRYSRQHDVVVGVPVSGRNRIETEGLIGFFVNTLVTRDDLSGNPTFSKLAERVRETMLGAFSNADVPFEKVVEILQPERSLGHNPIFQVMFATIKSAVRSQKFGNLTAAPYIVDTESSIFDLTMTVIEGIDGRWWAQIEYNLDLFSQERIVRMLDDYNALLKGIVANPEARILDLPIPSMPGPVDLPTDASTREPRKQNQQAIRTANIVSSRRTDPLDADQALLLKLWEEVLGVPDLGIDDSFFHAGGHSLLAARLINRIYETTGKQIPVSAIFRAPTIAEFAPLLRENIAPQPDPILVPLQKGDGVIPFFAIASPGTDTFGLSLLARHVAEDQSVYKLQASGPISEGRPFAKNELRALAQQYLAAMRLVQPHGPYCLGGMCEGVLIAQEIILTLEAEGEEVGLFAIFDTWVLENSQIPALWAIDYYRQRFQLFRGLPREEQRNTIKRAVKRLFFKNGKSAGSGWNQAYWPGDDFQDPQFQAPVLLFKRARQPYYYIRDREMGWGARSRSGVEIHELDCGHADILRQPHVEVLGQILTARLQEIKDRETRSDSEFPASD